MAGSAFAFAVALPQLGVLLMGLVVALAGFFDIRQGRFERWAYPDWIRSWTLYLGMGNTRVGIRATPGSGTGLNWLVSLSMMRDVMRGMKPDK